MRHPHLSTIVTLGALLALPVAADWRQFRGDVEQRGVSSEKLPAELEPLWTYELPGGTEATAAIVDGTVYLGGVEGKFVALELATGKERWAYAAGEEIKGSALVDAGRVYVGDEAGFLHALDAKTGALQWKFAAEGPISGGPNLAGGVLVVPSYDNRIYGLDAKDGKVRWQVETGGYVHGTPAIYDGQVIASGCDGQLRLLDLKTGKELAAVAVGTYVAASPAVGGKADPTAYFGTFDNDVVAFDLQKRAVRWRYQNPDREFPYYSSAALTQGLVILGGRDKSVHAIDQKTGKARWTLALRARVDASPLVVGDRVYVADHSGLLAALAVADGKELWRFESGEDFASSPAVAGGYLVIAAATGKVYGFGAGTGTGKRNPAP